MLRLLLPVAFIVIVVVARRTALYVHYPDLIIMVFVVGGWEDRTNEQIDPVFNEPIQMKRICTEKNADNDD